jgi:hypothetical protein
MAIYRSLLGGCGLVVLVSCVDALQAGTTWDGGGTTANWSDPGNWDPDGPPPPGASLTFGGTQHATSNQDLGNPFNVAQLRFDASATSGHRISGNPLRLGLFGQIVVENQPPPALRNAIFSPVEFSLGGFITTPVPTFGTALVIEDLRGSGVLSVDGAVSIHSANYAGPISATGRIEYGLGSSTFTGSQQIAGELYGITSLNFAPGSSLVVNGTLSPGGAPTQDPAANVPGPMTVNGNVVLRGELEWDRSALTQDTLDVNGTLDMDGLLQVNLLASTPPGQYLVASYDNRIGALDAPPGANYSVLYTSGENAGPGDILVAIVPEPALGFLTLVTLVVPAGLARRPRRGAGTRRHEL